MKYESFENFLQADSKSFVVKTLDRKTLWEMQTPQVLMAYLALCYCY